MVNSGEVDNDFPGPIWCATRGKPGSDIGDTYPLQVQLHPPFGDASNRIGVFRQGLDPAKDHECDPSIGQGALYPDDQVVRRPGCGQFTDGPYDHAGGEIGPQVCWSHRGPSRELMRRLPPHHAPQCNHRDHQHGLQPREPADLDVPRASVMTATAAPSWIWACMTSAQLEVSGHLRPSPVERFVRGEIRH